MCHSESGDFHLPRQRPKGFKKISLHVFEMVCAAKAMDSDGGERWGGDEKTWRASYKSESSAARAQ